MQSPAFESAIEHTAEPTSDTQRKQFLGQISASARKDLLKITAATWVALMGFVGFCAALALLLHAVMTQTVPPPMVWVLAVGGVSVRLVANLMRERLGQNLSARIRHQVRDQLLSAAARQGPLGLEQKGNAAWWAQLHMERVDDLHGYLMRYLPARLNAVATPLTIILISLAINWAAGLLFMLAIVLIPVSMAIIGMGTEAVHQKQQSQQARLASHLLERLEALPWLRRQQALKQTADDIDHAANDYRLLSMRLLRVAFLSSAALEFFSALGIGLLAIYIGFSLVGFLTFGPSVDVTLASGLFLLLLAPECFSPLRQLGQSHHDLNAAKAAAQSLALECLEPKQKELPANSLATSPALEALPAGIALMAQGICYTHPDTDHAVLKNLSLTVRDAEIVGISGHSGSGKSTLLNLMAGFLQPDQGLIQKTGTLSWINQQPHLFHDSLRNNLLLATDTTTSDEALIQTLAQVGLSLPSALLPKGLDTEVGDQNTGISGGQAQRIALARALLKGANLWCFDEPTSALDEQTRDEIVQTLFRLAKAHRVTVIIASHDTHLLDRCDRIVHLGRDL